MQLRPIDDHQFEVSLGAIERNYELHLPLLSKSQWGKDNSSLQCKYSGHKILFFKECRLMVCAVLRKVSQLRSCWFNFWPTTSGAAKT